MSQNNYGFIGAVPPEASIEDNVARALQYQGTHTPGVKRLYGFMTWLEITRMAIFHRVYLWIISKWEGSMLILETSIMPWWLKRWAFLT
jgi:hypothetical protein